MRPKDKLVSWFIRNIVIPKYEVMDKPGFLITNVTDKHGTVFVRELFISERFLELLERSVIKKFGDNARSRLYSAGKRFGYTYSALSYFPTRTKLNKKDFLSRAHFIIQYIGCMYSKSIVEKIDYDNKAIDFEIDQFVVCRNTGYGQFLTEGAIAGIWAYANEEPNIEAIQTLCQGRGDKRCTVTAAPIKYLQAKGLNPHSNNKISVPKRMDYDKFNCIRPLNNAKNSLQTLIDHNFFSYKGGSVTYANDRYFLAGSSIVYVLEEELKKLPGGDELLFNSALQVGKEIPPGKSDNYAKFISDFLPALGWGDIMVGGTKNNIQVFIEVYPWLDSFVNHEYVIIRGILSGMLSKFLGREVLLRKYKGALRPDGLTVKIYEK